MKLILLDMASFWIAAREVVDFSLYFRWCKHMYDPESDPLYRDVCGHCGTMAELKEANLTFDHKVYMLMTEFHEDEGTPKEPNSQAGWYRVTTCMSCGQLAFWHAEYCLYPQNVGVEKPNPDMPADIQDDYREAAQIANASPRAAAALLRLAIQKLCKELGGTGKHIDTDIGKLVADGLPVQVQKALDVVRFIGNNAVHPGSIDLKDDPATVRTLFKLVNMIAQRMISDPKQLQELYDSIPESQIEHIEERNQKAIDKAKNS